MPALPGTGRSTVGGQLTDLCGAASGAGPAIGPGKKTAEAIRKEVTREVDRFLQIVFQERRNNGWFDMEAIETAMRSAMHQAGAFALAQLLRYDPPDADH